MNKKYVIQGLIMLMFVQMTYAQSVGVNTDTPRATLDVNGSMRVAKDIKLGGEAGIAGDSGTEGEGFTSQGSDRPPVWSPLVSGSVSGYRIADSVVLFDKNGFRNPTSNAIKTLTQYLEDSDMTGWTELTGLRADITPKRKNNRVVVTLQTVGQSGAKTDVTGDLVFAIGIFIDDKLKSVRPISVYGANMTFSIATMFDSFQNLEPKANGGSYTIKVGIALRYRNVSGTNPPAGSWLALVGKSDSSLDNTTDAMNQTSLKVDLYEEIVQ